MVLPFTTVTFEVAAQRTDILTEYLERHIARLLNGSNTGHRHALFAPATSEIGTAP